MKRKILILLIILFIPFFLIICYSRFIGTSGLFIKEYAIKNKKIPPHFHGLKIVHISDIHFNKITNQKKLEQLAVKVNSLEPDIIVFTGDLFDHQINKQQQNELVLALFKLKAKLGKYVISGNHDLEFKEWEEIVTDAGFIILDSQHNLIYHQEQEPILIYGLSSNLEENNDLEAKLTAYHDYLDQNPAHEDIYKILLLHEPDFIDQFNYQKFDLILAGHSHGGQVKIPFIKPLFLPLGSQKYYNEHYLLNKTDLYISSGIGNSIFNLRFFNRPSFNFYRLISEKT